MMHFARARRTGAAVTLGAALLIGGCSEDPAPPFSITGSGDVEGLLFLDANEDANFDPSAGDQPLEGVQVVARNRGTDEVLSGGTTTTDAGGRFTLTGLPPGSHDIYFDEATLPEGASVCRNPIPTTIYLNETRFEGVAARPACLITIAAAKELPLGEFVIVRGIVTSFPGQMRGAYTQIQDDETGIRLFGSNLEGLGIEIGDLLEVGGTLTQFGGDLQLDPVTLREHIEDVANPVPDETTTAAIAEAGADPQAALGGRLVRVSAAQLTRGFTSGGNRNGLINDGSGVSELRIEAALSASGDETIRTTLGLQIGSCYDIVGTVGAFGGVGQLFPRSAADITEVTCN